MCWCYIHPRTMERDDDSNNENESMTIDGLVIICTFRYASRRRKWNMMKWDHCKIFFFLSCLERWSDDQNRCCMFRRWIPLYIIASAAFTKMELEKNWVKTFFVIKARTQQYENQANLPTKTERYIFRRKNPFKVHIIILRADKNSICNKLLFCVFLVDYLKDSGWITSTLFCEVSGELHSNE